ncbi:hypothetical protein M422DRAFT_169052, partial [Sphaerobolus stellatus SS14]
PPDLNILWTPDAIHTPLPSALPPPELLQDALVNLLITLHPQTQHRATYSTQDGSPVEPTLGLYCPIEGGEYVIDETVRDLARRARAEVVVLDTIEVAAGEWGAFGKAASVIQLPENPLHFPPSAVPSSPSPSSSNVAVEEEAEDDDDNDGPHFILSASQPFPFGQLNLSGSRQSRSSIVISRRTPPSKAKMFFDDIVNIPSPSTESRDLGLPLRSPPRIIYIRDYPTLAPMANSWFPSLVASVRGHRQGPLSRPTSPVTSPVTIILGMTPPIIPQRSQSAGASGSPAKLLNLLLNRRLQTFPPRRNDYGKTAEPWDESEAAEKARERRLQDRLRLWEHGDPRFYEELPEPPTSSERSPGSASGSSIIIAGPIWVEEFSGKTAGEKEREKESEGTDQPPVDEVIEKVKRDSSLEPHEQRLLGCIVDPALMTTSFDQVHLPTHTIDSVRTIVSLPLLHPHAFAHGILKYHAMTGALLFGPPGTGKTLIVRALAKESGARMLLIKPSDVLDMYVGEGEKLVRSVFSLARRLSPCVVFLDELDALLGARVSGRESGGALAHRAIITEFMQEMDGLRSSSKDSNVIVIGATNRPFDLDDAVLRRLPRRLLVDLPGEKERKEILKILLCDEKLAPEIDLDHLAKRTEAFSGSDLKHLCVAAALDAVKQNVILPWTVHRPDKPAEKTLEATSDSTATPIPEPTAAAETAAETAGETVAETVAKILAPASTSASASDNGSAAGQHRVLQMSNFNKALKEITPSASESLGTLADLRKWNEQFGEGGRQQKKKMWGRGFGFTKANPEGGEGKVDVNVTTGQTR